MNAKEIGQMHTDKRLAEIAVGARRERDKIALVALPEIIRAETADGIHFVDSGGPPIFDRWAQSAYRMADAMIKEGMG